ncbi:MAG: PaaI family thioesterase [Candidatus Tectomicrobia bacterium]|nr:PaaI family thioesterase [Candidatus Tectomicrobia bacterium]
MASDAGRGQSLGGLTKEELHALVKQHWRGTFNGLVGLEFLDGGEGFCRLRLPVRPEILQPWGTVHGGAVATLLDVTGGVGAHLSYPRGSRLLTLEMKINFIGTQGEGALLSEGALLHRGRRTTVWQMKAVDEAGGRLRACATATYMVLEGGPEGFPG